MQHIIHSFFYIHTYKITRFFFFLFQRIDSVNTALGPLGIHISATICEFLFCRKYPETPALAFADDFFCLWTQQPPFPWKQIRPIFYPSMLRSQKEKKLEELSESSTVDHCVSAR